MGASEAQARVVAVKGSELPAHMPQVKHSLGFIYAVNPFGADHQSSEHDPMYEPGSGRLHLDRLAELGLENPVPSDDLGAEKGRFALRTQYVYSLMDTLCLCQFDWGPARQLYGPTPMVEAVQAVTGWDVDLEEFVYYQMAGWDAETGSLTRERLEELELEWVTGLLAQ